jgi:hypothetical protein
MDAVIIAPGKSLVINRFSGFGCQEYTIGGAARKGRAGIGMEG